MTYGAIALGPPGECCKTWLRVGKRFSVDGGRLSARFPREREFVNASRVLGGEIEREVDETLRSGPVV
jgi:hypothetical protein